MDNNDSFVPHPYDDARGRVACRVGSWVAVATSLVTILTFALAITAVPNSGRNCRTDCVAYPFTDETVAEQFPADYLWMFPAMVVTVLFVALVACLHECAGAGRKVFSLTALCLAVIAAAVLLVDYFVQVTVMKPSLEKGQLEGLALVTQYNPNGVFIALEELGYLLMSVAFVVVAPVLPTTTRVERALRWLLVAGFAATIVALGVVAGVYGSDRQDSFEVPVISIVWLVLVTAGPLLAVVLKRSASSTIRLMRA